MQEVPDALTTWQEKLASAPVLALTPISGQLTFDMVASNNQISYVIVQECPDEMKKPLRYLSVMLIHT